MVASRLAQPPQAHVYKTRPLTSYLSEKKFGMSQVHASVLNASSSLKSTKMPHSSYNSLSLLATKEQEVSQPNSRQ